MNSFVFSFCPETIFGTGKISHLPDLIERFGKRALIITGAKSFINSESWEALFPQLEHRNIKTFLFTVKYEPSSALINDAVSIYGNEKIDVVVSIGGGSVMDAGKAIAAMLPVEGDVKDYLEGVGTKIHPGLKVPFIAIPTTSGTGSEASKNAVISEVGPKGFKKSLRHPNFIPNAIILDPNLTISCPPAVTASSGMDAFTQLLESYLSSAANPISDALALEGLKLISEGLRESYFNGNDLEARSKMQIAAYLSGITLANAGLGIVHGIAGVVGGLSNIPHGVICSSMMYPCNLATVKKLKQKSGSEKILAKFGEAGALFTKEKNKSTEYYIDVLLDKIKAFTEQLNIPTLSAAGLNKELIPEIVNLAENKNNPVHLSKEEIAEVLTNI